MTLIPFIFEVHFVGKRLHFWEIRSEVLVDETHLLGFRSELIDELVQVIYHNGFGLTPVLEEIQFFGNIDGEGGIEFLQELSQKMHVHQVLPVFLSITLLHRGIPQPEFGVVFGLFVVLSLTQRLLLFLCLIQLLGIDHLLEPLDY